MSCFFLCDKCEKKVSTQPNFENLLLSTVDCTDGHKHLRLMIDHGHAGGRRPYDDPLDVCSDFVRKDETVDSNRKM